MTIWVNMAILVVLTVLIGGVLGTAAELVIGPKQMVAAMPALALCVSSAALTLAGADWVRRRMPGVLPAAVMAGSAMRLMVAVIGVVALAPVLSANGVPAVRFAEWTAVFYIVTLAIESGLLVRATAAGLARNGDGAASGRQP